MGKGGILNHIWLLELYNGHWTRLPDYDKTVKLTENVVGVNVDECPDHDPCISLCACFDI